MISTAWTYDGMTHISRQAPGGSGKVQIAAIPTIETLQQRLPDISISKQKVPAALKWNSVPPKVKVNSPSTSTETLVSSAQQETEEGEITDEQAVEPKIRKSPRKSPRNAQTRAEVDEQSTAGPSGRGNFLSRVVNGKTKKK